jgi:uncharacterized cupin superfamily protein
LLPAGFEPGLPVVDGFVPPAVDVFSPPAPVVPEASFEPSSPPHPALASAALTMTTIMNRVITARSYSSRQSWKADGGRTLNINDTDWDVERSFEGAETRMLHLGRRLGGELLGATIFELDPGVRGISHFHYGNEEWVLVLDGTPTLRTPAGERSVEKGDVAVFPRGPGGTHALSNDSESVCRFVVFSSMRDPDVVVYPDASAVGAIAGDAPTAGLDAPFEAFFPTDARIEYSKISGQT